MTIGLFYGSSTCYTEMVAEKIQALLGADHVRLHNLKQTPIQQMTDYQILMLGISTWDFGEIQEDWLASWDAIDTIDLHGKVVALFGVESAVTLLAESHQIRPVVRAAISKLPLMVNKGCWCKPAVLLAQLAERIRRQERRPNPCPRSAVALIALRVTVVSVISFGFLLCVFLAVPITCQIAATGVGAGLLCFIRHCCSPPIQGM